MNDAAIRSRYDQELKSYQNSRAAVPKWQLASTTNSAIKIASFIAYLLFAILQIQSKGTLFSFSAILIIEGSLLLHFFVIAKLLDNYCLKKIKENQTNFKKQHHLLYYLHCQSPGLVPLPPPLIPPTLAKLQRSYKEECSTSSLPFSSLTKQDRFIPSQNRAREEDIALYTRPVTDLAFSQFLSSQGFYFSPHLQLEPFEEGVCGGASLFFAKEYLQSDNLIATAEQFRNGAPYEAVLLQAKTSLKGSITPEAEGFQSKRILLTPKIAGLFSFAFTAGFDAREALEKLSHLENGVHLLTIMSRKDSSNKDRESSHAILFIKREANCALFDPNIGTAIFPPERLRPIVEEVFSSLDYSDEKGDSPIVTITTVQLLPPQESLHLQEVFSLA